MTKLAFVVAASLVMMSARPSGRQAVVPPDLGWVGFFNDRLVTWLENENQLESLCATLAKDTDAWRACRKEKLAPQVHVVRLWHGPTEKATQAGSLRLEATPGRGLKAIYVPPSRGSGIEFTPDLYDSDWGYGPYFHMTIVERRDTWFRLPEDPFPPNTWINAAELGGAPAIRVIEAGEILRGAFGDLYVIGLEQGVLRARAEQTADMWCQIGEPPPLKPWKEQRIPFRDLYSPTGHLKIHIKYTRGC